MFGDAGWLLAGSVVAGGLSVSEGWGVQTKIVIIGSGFGGIGMGIALKKAGFCDFVILEKSTDLGGTWRDNRYPGCACDVPSPLYSFSYELNPSWSRLFAPQPEIWQYLRECAAKYGIDAHIRYDSKVEGMEWDDAARLWTVRPARCATPSTGCWSRERSASRSTPG
jgi:cation diffusion facilitator CzcD-associated flavoprotein CzcO